MEVVVLVVAAAAVEVVAAVQVVGLAGMTAAPSVVQVVAPMRRLLQQLPLSALLLCSSSRMLRPAAETPATTIALICLHNRNHSHNI